MSVLIPSMPIAADGVIADRIGQSVSMSIGCGWKTLVVTCGSRTGGRYRRCRSRDSGSRGRTAAQVVVVERVWRGAGHRAHLAVDDRSQLAPDAVGPGVSQASLQVSRLVPPYSCAVHCPFSSSLWSRCPAGPGTEGPPPI